MSSDFTKQVNTNLVRTHSTAGFHVPQFFDDLVHLEGHEVTLILALSKNGLKLLVPIHPGPLVNHLGLEVGLNFGRKLSRGAILQKVTPPAFDPCLLLLELPVLIPRLGKSSPGFEVQLRRTRTS